MTRPSAHGTVFLEARLAQLRADGRRGLAPYITAGDGGLDTTLAVLRALDDAGADVVELGLPFSDPVADGPQLQAAAERSLALGTNLRDVAEVVRRLRSGDDDAPPSDLPIVVMTYANLLSRRGWGSAIGLLAAAGCDGVLVADLPLEEAVVLRIACAETGLAPLFLVAPTTGADRLAQLAAASRGFLYAIGRVGTTGVTTRFDEDTQDYLGRVAEAAGARAVGVGFGIAGPDDVSAALRHADLAIVGSALVEHLHRAVASAPHPSRAPALAARAATTFLEHLSEGLNP